MATVLVKMQCHVQDGTFWETSGFVLGLGEIGYNTSESSWKFGDGSSRWPDLRYRRLEAVQASYDNSIVDSLVATETKSALDELDTVLNLVRRDL